MNQFQKAIHKIREYSNLGFYSKERSNLAERHFREYKEDLQKLADKATPRKVRRFELEVNGRVDYHRESCDVCNTVLFEYEAPKYCHECGQALDWSEDETK